MFSFFVNTKIDRETGSGVGERESELHIEKKIERVTW